MESLKKFYNKNTGECAFMAAMIIALVSSASTIKMTKAHAQKTQKAADESPNDKEKQKENRKWQSHARLTIEFTAIPAIALLGMLGMTFIKDTTENYGKKMQYFIGIFVLLVLSVGIVEVGMQPEPKK